MKGRKEKGWKYLGGCSSPAKRPTKASAPGSGRRRRRPTSRLSLSSESERGGERDSQNARGLVEGIGMQRTEGGMRDRRRKKKDTRTGLLAVFHNFFGNFCFFFTFLSLPFNFFHFLLIYICSLYLFMGHYQ